MPYLLDNCVEIIAERALDFGLGLVTAVDTVDVEIQRRNAKAAPESCP